MTDIHCHILYGVDDGSDCLAESIDMARIALESGTHQIIATPHANIPDAEDNAWGPLLEDTLAKLNESLVKEGIDVLVLGGQEVFAAGDLIQRINSGELITLNKSRYLLTEFDFYERSDFIFSTCDSLLAEGLVPVIAHPERYAAVQSDEETVFSLRDMGCLFQLNKGSLFGSFGQSAQETAHRMLEESLADFIASDAHSPYMRTPFMADAHEMVCELYSLDYAEFLFRENPALLLADKEINPF